MEQTLRQAAAAQGQADARWVNRLVLEHSPYLLQHAHNPVDWYPWGAEATARAAALDRPIFLSIGYSTCHWCHVMAHESFEDPEIAALINASFVAVKVDREERPDIDEVYMTAVQAMNRGRGGWPMTLVLTPDGKPIFAATYLPARDGDRGSRRGLAWILGQIRDDWNGDRAALLSHADQITQYLVSLAAPAPPAGVPGVDVVERGVDQLMSSYDPVHGGFGGAPKFPRPVALDLLLRAKKPRLEAVRHTLSAMARGGVQDQVGGGFHRYSVDAAWRVPHFEKMLYDNAQLVGTATDAWRATGDPELAAVVERTVAYMLAELRQPGGGFASAVDADSRTASGELEEGVYYTWTPAEVATVLGDQAAMMNARLGITEKGQVDGRSVPSMARPPDVAEAPGVKVALERLREARSARPAPALDDKVIAAWNGYAISALARASTAFDRPEWAEAASAAAGFVLEELRGSDGRLRRAWRAGRAQYPAMLDDEAAMAVACVDLFAATHDPRWLSAARERLAVVEAEFADPRGGWFRTPHDGEALLVRPRDDHEGAEPSGAALAVHAALRMAHLTGDADLQVVADRALAAFGAEIEAQPTAMPWLTAAVGRRHAPAQEIVVVWPQGTDPSTLWAVIRKTWRPHAAEIAVPAAEVADLSAHVPWLEGKVPQHDLPTAYVCRGGVCRYPVTTPAELTAALRADASAE